LSIAVSEPGTREWPITLLALPDLSTLTTIPNINAGHPIDSHVLAVATIDGCRNFVLHLSTLNTTSAVELLT
jgi:hypothetical protein